VHAPFGRDVIESLIPHRPPFLLVDEILELDPGKRVVGRREIRADDWWFPGHFPERPVMPGVLTIEAIAQAGAVAVLADEANRGKIPFFAGIDDCRFKRVVEPGDVLTLECEFVRVRGPIAKGQGRALVGDEVAAEAMLTVFVGTGVGSTEPASSGGAGVDGAGAK
jgi:3-hydroxyacyl-[acyl-carrier-protein] dehydratase